MEINLLQCVKAISLCLLVFFASCQTSKQTKVATQRQDLTEVTTNINPISHVAPKPKMCEQMEKMGLVSIQSIIPNIRIDLPYGTSENFTGVQLYETTQYAYFQKDVANKLAEAYKILSEKYPQYYFLILDAARPMSVQLQMWNAVKGTQGRYFVANPNKTGLHNYGAAVDITLTDKHGNLIDMGCPFDTFSALAHTDKEEELLQNGLLTEEQYRNRKILREVMIQAGFKPIKREWWHFNACSLEEAKIKYELIQ